jgi:glutathione S-transferase
LAASRFRLVIANRNYSSWSLRAWLFLKVSDVPFEEIRIPMFTDTWVTDIARYTPAGRVPVLLDGDVTVWDSTAIIQYVREQYPDAVDWPGSQPARAHAQSISGEMHSGFLAVRDELPLNIRARRPREVSELSDSCRRQLDRIDEIWSDCRAKYGGLGEWLFGDFSIADIMFAPVALRFLTYAIPLSEPAAEFQHAVVGHPRIAEWVAMAKAEPEAISFLDELVPAAKSALTLG